MKAQKLPGLDFVQAHLTALEGIVESAVDDCVKTLAGEGKSYKEARSRVSKLKEAVSEKNLRVFQDARVAMKALWPPVKVRTEDESLIEKASELCTLIESETFYDAIAAIRLAAQHIAEVFQCLYRHAHENRTAFFRDAWESVKGLEDYAAITENPSIINADRQALLAPLLQRACEKLDVPWGSAHCNGCGSTLDQLVPDAALVEAIRDNVVRKVQELATHDGK